MSSPLQDLLGRMLMTRWGGDDRNKLMRRLPSVDLGFESDATRTLVAVLLDPKNSTDQGAAHANNCLWRTFVHACGDNATTISDVIDALLQERGNDDVYITPNLRFWWSKMYNDGELI